MVEITKLRTNYRLRYNYLNHLSTFIKSLPKDHRKVKMDVIQNPNGTFYEDWYREVSNAFIGKIICFIKDNNIPFKFTNLSQEEVEVLRKEFLEQQKRTSEILKLKAQNINIDGYDFSYLKIEPYKYQKEAVVFFDKCGGTAILGDQPGVGKSLCAMAYATKDKLKTLIICPASLKLNWRNEILKFTNETPYIYKWKPTKKSGRVNYPKKDSLFHIINYEAIETYAKPTLSHKCSYCNWTDINMTKRYKECPNCKRVKTIKSRRKDVVFTEDKDGDLLKPIDYDLLIIDEAHFIKSQRADRSKIIKKIFITMPKKLLLTGTAIKSRPYEFFSLLNFVDPKTWKNAHSYGVRYCAAEETQYGWNYDGASNLD